jgi:hypothetical protein
MKMKIRIILLLLLPALASAMPLDTSVFRYFPLKTGNRWTWYRDANTSPGTGFETMKIMSTQVINNHLYYLSRYDRYYSNGNLISSTNSYYRIDSLSGNLYQYQTSDCLVDSLNSVRNDSAYSTCITEWSKCDTSSYLFFSQNIDAKKFSWKANFELDGNKKYAKNIGRVYEARFAVTNYIILNLRGCLIDGILSGDTSTLVGINLISTVIPETFSLEQNYPNPFNPATNIEFSIPGSGHVNLTIYDVMGREVETLVNYELKAGTYKADWSASKYPSGVYFYKLSSGDFIQTKRMILLK